MSLYGSMFSGVSGLNAQGSAIAMISDNIANINTDGYKGSEAQFATLVTSSSGSIGYSSGGVTASPFQKIDKQGLIKTTGVTTDLSISGSGFFPVNGNADLNGDFVYTRAGSFGKDSRGRLVNTSGYYLLAWPLDSEGRLPGEPGNLDTTSSALLDSLAVVNVGSVSGNASQTTSVNLGINLKSSETLMKGTGGKILFPTNSSIYKKAALDVIVPDSVAGIEMGREDKITFTPSSVGQSYTFTYDGFAESNNITSTAIAGATTANTIFGGSYTTAGGGGVAAGHHFTITTNVAGSVTTYTYTFTPSSPTTSKGEFNNLNTLAEAINRSGELSARVANNRLYVTNHDANQAITFADVTGKFVADLGVTNVPAANGGDKRFATLRDFSNKINAQPGLRSVVSNPLDGSSVDFYARDPLGTLKIDTTNIAVGSTQASILKQLGLTNGVGATLPAAYSATDATRNLSGGRIQTQFSRNVRVFDALGTGHDFQVSFGKIDDNTWTAEIYSLNPSEISTSRTDGQIAEGIIEFNGDGTLRNVSASLSVPIEVIWTNKAMPSSITFNWGTAGEVSGTIGATSIGRTDGLRQLDSDYSVDFVNQNGISAGLLSGIEIDSAGFVIAQFSNGTSRKIYRIPLADFTSPNSLERRAGNVYAETTGSGNFNLKKPDSGGVGKIEPGTLEQANVELSDELTRMIVAQRGYQANSKVIKTVNEMLEDLNRIF